MSSIALAEWRTARAGRIQELLDAHQDISEVRQETGWRTTQLNWALTLLVVAEFQGFSRSLHDLAVDEFAGQTGKLNAHLSATLRRIMTAGRQLDRGNPGPDALASDFARLGMEFWRELGSAYPAWTPRAQTELQSLLDARNGIAHSDHRKIAMVEQRGYPLSQLETVRSWYGWTNRLAEMMDVTVGSYIARLFGGSAPW